MSRTASALEKVDRERVDIANQTARAHKEIHGQFMTQAAVANYMAELFDFPRTSITVLDAGSGIGSLSIALSEFAKLKTVETDVTAIELDTALFSKLRHNLCSSVSGSSECRNFDFVEWAVNQIQFSKERFSHAIINPPYKKIGTNSHYRMLGRAVGVETVNLYSLFTALCILLLEEGGQLVAILPRSFCNGPYYRAFRELILKECAIEHFHLFESRKSVFSGDEVLQENIILKVRRGAKQGKVRVSHSTNETFADLSSSELDFQDIVHDGDSQTFFHVPTKTSDSLTFAQCGSLAELGIKVSTGPIVDFRARDALLDQPTENSVPLLYPMHFSSGKMQWPVVNGKKANALEINESTQRSFYKAGWYVVVRRFSSKEEKRRIIPRVVDPSCIKEHHFLSFENHLNVFHENKEGLEDSMAYGLAAYLGSDVADDRFRAFSGHTQVNATDLRHMPYPNKEALMAFGEWIKRDKPCRQNIEQKLRDIL